MRLIPGFIKCAKRIDNHYVASLFIQFTKLKRLKRFADKHAASFFHPIYEIQFLLEIRTIFVTLRIGK